MNKITLKEGFIDLYNRMQKQFAETAWTIERVKPMSQKEIEEFQGKVVKKKLLNRLKKELEERQKNLKVLEKILQKYGK